MTTIREFERQETRIRDALDALLGALRAERERPSNEAADQVYRSAMQARALIRNGLRLLGRIEAQVQDTAMSAIERRNRHYRSPRPSRGETPARVLGHARHPTGSMAPERGPAGAHAPLNANP